MKFVDEIKKGLNTKYIGKKIYHFAEVNSTNDMAKKLADKCEDGSVVIADVQKRGKGRLGREWISPSGGIYLSIFLKPRIDPSTAPRLTLTFGLAVAKTIRKLGLDAKIKWPNDILINGKKVSGILTEADVNNNINYIIAGIGIDANVDIDTFPIELQYSATSLNRELKKPVNRVELIRELLEEIEKYYDIYFQDYHKIFDEWRSLSDTIGRVVEIKTQKELIIGEAVGVDLEGELLVELSDGTLKKIIAGECIYME
ncbi:MAG TPA: biotin--[acetyl-CoA-carboxylase] ligase [Methanosarcinales archaeon]|nr:biotin--[acetyl-CoA-carboxylase] ligase [Methanosarcinales archaeon]